MSFFLGAGAMSARSPGIGVLTAAARPAKRQPRPAMRSGMVAQG